MLLLALLLWLLLFLLLLLAQTTTHCTDVQPQQEAVDRQASSQQKPPCRMAQPIQQQCLRPMAQPMSNHQVAEALP